jgi:hypothetical protein
MQICEDRGGSPSISIQFLSPALAARRFRAAFFIWLPWFSRAYIRRHEFVDERAGTRQRIPRCRVMASRRSITIVAPLCPIGERSGPPADEFERGWMPAAPWEQPLALCTGGTCRPFLHDLHFSRAMRTCSHLPFTIRATFNQAKGERIARCKQANRMWRERGARKVVR